MPIHEQIRFVFLFVLQYDVTCLAFLKKNTYTDSLLMSGSKVYTQYALVFTFIIDLKGKAVLQYHQLSAPKEKPVPCKENIDLSVAQLQRKLLMCRVGICSYRMYEMGSIALRYTFKISRKRLDTFQMLEIVFHKPKHVFIFRDEMDPAMYIRV